MTLGPVDSNTLTVFCEVNGTPTMPFNEETVYRGKK